MIEGGGFVPLGPLRIALGLLAIFFAFYFGRALVLLSKGVGDRRKTITWFLRAFVSAGANVWSGGLDWISIAVIALVLVTAGAGYYTGLKPPEQEDLSKKIVPHED